jgi:hypothetical protein
MALTASLSQKELQRVAELAYEGYAVRVSLANDVGGTLGPEDTVTAWDAVKVTGSGYADFKGTIGEGAYNIGNQRYQLPAFDAEFTANTTGYVFNRVYVVLGEYNAVDIDTTELTSNVATVVTTGVHGFSNGDEILIRGATDTSYNGYHIITSVPTTSSFTFALVAADKASASSDGTAATITENSEPHSVLSEEPAITLASGQVQTYRVLLATDD